MNQYIYFPDLLSLNANLIHHYQSMDLSSIKSLWYHWNQSEYIGIFNLIFFQGFFLVDCLIHVLMISSFVQFIDETKKKLNFKKYVKTLHRDPNSVQHTMLKSTTSLQISTVEKIFKEIIKKTSKEVLNKIVTTPDIFTNQISYLRIKVTKNDDNSFKNIVTSSSHPSPKDLKYNLGYNSIIPFKPNVKSVLKKQIIEYRDLMISIETIDTVFITTHLRSTFSRKDTYLKNVLKIGNIDKDMYLDNFENSNLDKFYQHYLHQLVVSFIYIWYNAPIIMMISTFIIDYFHLLRRDNNDNFSFLTLLWCMHKCFNILDWFLNTNFIITVFSSIIMSFVFNTTITIVYWIEHLVQTSF